MPNANEAVGSRFQRLSLSLMKGRNRHHFVGRGMKAMILSAGL
jgi:hypothetical protein